MDNIDLDKLPYRENVACIVFSGDKFLVVQLAEWEGDWWKFPQGGIDDGESEEDAVKRELFEELGTSSFNIIKKSQNTRKYDWTDDIIKAVNYKWRGQYQKFFLVEFLGKDDEIKIDTDELRRYKWVDLKELAINIDHGNKIFIGYKDKIMEILEEFSMA